MDVGDVVFIIIISTMCIGGLSIFLMPFYQDWLELKNKELDNERRAIELGSTIIPRGFKK